MQELLLIFFKKMKQNIFPIIICLLFLTSVASISKLRSASLNQKKCKALPSEIREILGDDLFPALYQKKSKKAMEKAEEQTMAARKLFYFPNEDVKAMLIKVSKKLKHVIGLMTDEVFTDKDFNRAIQKGVLDQWSKLDITASLARIVSGNKATGQDNIGVLALMGDIGSSVMDFDPDGKLEEANGVFYAILSKMKNIQKQTLLGKDFFKQSSIINQNYGGKILCPSKKVERSTFDTSKIGNKLRGGILNIAEEIDVEINKKYKIEKGLIPKLNWPWQTVPALRIENCNDEPWSGHLSGSIPGLLYALDILSEDDPLLYITEKNLKKRAKDERIVKAALGAAFFIATGYHSAIELEITVRAYIGDDPIELVDGVKCPPIPSDKSEITKKLIGKVMKCIGACTKNIKQICTGKEIHHGTAYITRLISKFIDEKKKK